MKRAILCLFAILFAASSIAAQSAEDKEKKQRYDERLKALRKDDWDGKVALAKWCQENGLAAQFKTLLTEVIKAKPEHEEARKLLGYVKHEGKWVMASDLEKVRAAAKEKELKEHGYVKWKDQWVLREDIPYLEKGMIKVGDQWMTKEDKEKLDKGFMLVDGEWVAPEEAENVKKGLYKVEGKWVSLEDADQYHNTWELGWKLTTTHFRLVTNLDRKTAEIQKQVIEDTYSRLYQIFQVDLKNKPPVYIIATDKEFSDYAAQNAGHHSSVWPGCLAENDPEKPAVAVYEKNFLPYYLSHAVAHLYMDRISKSAPIPLWFEEAVATYVSRFYTPELRKWSVENIEKRGSLGSMKEFTDNFEISGDDADGSQKKMLEAGLLAAYCLQGGNEAAKKSFMEAAAAVGTGDKGKIAKAVSGVLSRGDEIHKGLKAFIKSN